MELVPFGAHNITNHIGGAIPWDVGLPTAPRRRLEVHLIMATIANVTFEPGDLPAATESRIRWFEESYRVRLPRAYVELLKGVNGGVPIECVFPQGHRTRLVERFLPLLDVPRDHPTRGWYDVSVVLAQLDDRLVDRDDLVGMNVIPIAALFGGDLVCLDFRNNDQPTVAVWDHEQSEELAPHLEQVAGSFEEFLSSLRKPQE